MATRTMKSFNDAKGYGFIRPEGGGRISSSTTPRSWARDTARCVRARVEFEAREGQKGPEATNVTAID